MLMSKFNNLIVLTPAVCMALTAAAAERNVVNPAEYGSFHSRSLPSQPKKAKGIPGGGGMKVHAFAGSGNAEVDKYGKLILVDQEDFSKLTQGSEEAPDLSVDLAISQYLTNEDGSLIFDEYNNPIENPEYQYPWNNMKREYISGTGGWGVGNAFPAGGSLYFPFSSTDMQGKISTPWLDLSAHGGTFVLEFKVKVTEEALNNSVMPAMIIVETAETNNMSPTWDMFEDSFMNYQNLSTEWTTFRLIFQGAGSSTLCNIVGQGMSGGMYIDDVKVYTLDPYLETPVLRRHTDFASDSLTLNWSPVENADKYEVTLWYDDLYGDRVWIHDKKEVEGTSLKVEGTNLDDVYYFTVSAVNSEHRSLESRSREVFDIVAPKMRQAVCLDEASNLFEGGVEEVISAFGYNYFAMQRRTAESDGPFVVTNEEFTGWTHPLYAEGEFYTKENPADDRIASLYFPTDLKQQGWYGQNFQIYKDYICLCPFFYEASLHQDQSAWVSPEFDLSKDGGRISVSMKLAAAYDSTFENYASCVVGLYNWNEEKGDYDQAETIYCGGLGFDWTDKTVELTGGSSRSKIAFFAVGSYGDLYIDDIVISQNYKAGDTFDDPFYFSTWQLAESVWDPTVFEFEVPEHAMTNGIYQRAQAVRMHFGKDGNYDGEVSSPFSETDFVSDALSGVRLVDDGVASGVSVADGVIMISNPGAEAVSVADMSGVSVRLGSGTSLAYKAGAKGVYVVTIGGRSVKVCL